VNPRVAGEIQGDGGLADLFAIGKFGKRYDQLKLGV